MRWWENISVSRGVLKYHEECAFYPGEAIDWLKKMLLKLFAQYVNTLGLVHDVKCHWRYAGSVAEGVRVVHPDETIEVDAEFVINVSGFPLSRKGEDGCCIQIDPPSDMAKWKLPDSFIGMRGHVSAKRVLDLFDETFHVVLPSWNSAFRKYGCAVHREQGPAENVTVSKNGRPWISIDLVPALHIAGEGSFVAKRRLGCPAQDFFWRESFATMERKQYPVGQPWVKACLRLLNAFHVRNPELGQLTTYVLKNVVFWELDERPDDSWEEEDVGRRFLGLLAHLRAGLRDGFITQFFNPRVNLLRSISEYDLDRMNRYIHNLLCDERAFIQAINSR